MVKTHHNKPPQSAHQVSPHQGFGCLSKIAEATNIEVIKVIEGLNEILGL